MTTWVHARGDVQRLKAQPGRHWRRHAVATAWAADGVVSVGLYPGLVRTEGMMQFAGHLDLTDSQSPEGVGRIKAAPAADAGVMSLTGCVLTVAELARCCGIDPNT